MTREQWEEELRAANAAFYACAFKNERAAAWARICAASGALAKLGA
ncbi:hypothetical protein LMG26858_04406 [Achromobacter anxifer]|uniref:Uncharacterized protein n=1 Tax=Achromobacter anxifer TaxID=1287737 RepID=A0A6S7EAV5_9BURK|nr:hypothetical protein LMG26858_04406 [Achromobacter anxifer]